jgi:hypothetical protein
MGAEAGAALFEAEVELIPSLADLGGAAFAVATPTVKLIVTPLLNGEAAELIDVDDAMCWQHARCKLVRKDMSIKDASCN